MSLPGRVARIERQLIGADRAGVAARYQHGLSVRVVRLLAGWLALRATMDPGDAAEVERELAQLDDAFHQWHRCGPLTRHAMTLAGSAGTGRHRGPLALPPAVAAVVRDDPRLDWTHRCEGCGLVVPRHAGTRFVVTAEHQQYQRVEADRDLLDACPLCGGRVAWTAREPPIFRIPDAVWAEAFDLVAVQAAEINGGMVPHWFPTIEHVRPA